MGKPGGFATNAVAVWGALSLGELAARAGWSAADVMAVSGVSKSAVGRWWSDPEWLEHAGGAGVQMLAVTVPGVREYVDHRAQVRAVSRAAEMCESAGLEVSSVAVTRLLTEERVTAGELVPALLAGAALASTTEGGGAAGGVARERVAVEALARCWGVAADHAGDALFIPMSEGGVFVDSSAITEGAQRLQMRRGDDVTEVVGRGIALHKLIKHLDVEPDRNPPVGGTARRGGLAGVFRYRSTVIGRIFADGDDDAVRAYRRVLMRDPVLQWNEVWSLASYAGDLARDRVERVPMPRVGLVRTASRVLADLTSPDDAGASYRRYLISCAVPLLLAYDPTFGGHRQQLARVMAALDDGDHVRAAVAATDEGRGSAGSVPSSNP